MRANVTSEKAQKALGIVWFRLDPATRRELALEHSLRAIGARSGVATAPPRSLRVRGSTRTILANRFSPGPAQIRRTRKGAAILLTWGTPSAARTHHTDAQE